MAEKIQKKMQFEVFLKRNIFTGMTTAIKSNLVNLEQPNKYPLLHDAWYIPVSLLLGQHGILINEPLTLYRQHSKQLYGAPKKNFKIKPIQYKIDDNISLQLRILNNLNTFSINNNLKNENVIMLREKIDHLNYRLFIRKRKIRDKTFLILKEFIKGNYNKYSSNYSALFDFIL